MAFQQSWLEEARLPEGAEADVLHALAALKPIVIATGGVLFRPGDEALGFIIVLSGRISVFLTGASGREILLYDVINGQSCVQSTLGLLGGEAYSGEAIAETDVRAVLVPRVLFLELMNSSAWFRKMVFVSFGERIGDITRVLEQVAFVKVEQRLARHLLASADEKGAIDQTHQELAVAIGTVREVVSRRLEALARRGLVTLERGQIIICNRADLQVVAAEIID